MVRSPWLSNVSLPSSCGLDWIQANPPLYGFPSHTPRAPSTLVSYHGLEPLFTLALASGAAFTQTSPSPKGLLHHGPTTTATCNVLSDFSMNQHRFTNFKYNLQFFIPRL
eukprot:Gb_06685 [translate_table: standard]